MSGNTLVLEFSKASSLKLAFRGSTHQIGRLTASKDRHQHAERLNFLQIEAPPKSLSKRSRPLSSIPSAESEAKGIQMSRRRPFRSPRNISEDFSSWLKRFRSSSGAWNFVEAFETP